MYFLSFFVQERSHTHTHWSVCFCCLNAIHHHFICLNWMPSGPLILPISPLTNSCSPYTQKNNTQQHNLSQTRFTPIPVSASPFVSLVQEWEKASDGVDEWFIRQKVMLWGPRRYYLYSFLPSGEKQPRRIKGRRGQKWRHWSTNGQQEKIKEERKKNYNCASFSSKHQLSEDAQLCTIRLTDLRVWSFVFESFGCICVYSVPWPRWRSKHNFPDHSSASYWPWPVHLSLRVAHTQTRKLHRVGQKRERI